MRPLIVSALSLSLLLGGCATTGFPGARPLTYKTSGEARMFATGGPCIHEPAGQEAAGLVAALLAGAASKLLENFGTALTEGAKGGQLPSSVATTNLQLAPGTLPRCIVFIRGSFAQAGDEAEVDLAATLAGVSNDAEARRRLSALGLPPIYRLDQFIELRLVNSANNTAVTFAPVYAHLARSIDGSSRGERDLSIALKFNKVGTDGVGGVVLLPDRRLGATGQVFTAGTGGRYIYESPWFGSFNPPPTRAPAANGAGELNPPAQQPGSGAADMQYAGADGVAVSGTITVVETRPTNEGLAFVASVFGAVRPKIEEAIRSEIDDDFAATAQAADLTLQATYATAEGAARTALLAYCRSASVGEDAAGLQDRVTKSAAARAAQINANAAALRAGAPQPFATLVVISGAAVTPSTGGCQGA